MRLSSLLLVGATILCVGGCASTLSSKGLYGDTPGPQPVKGSNAQAVVTRTVDFTYDEVMDAAQTALFRRGINVEENDRAKGRITGTSHPGVFPNAHDGFVSTMAVYVKQTSPKPITQITVVMDRQTIMGWGGGERTAANEVMADIQKVLATYR